jgi:hypothetical protein
MPEYSPQGEISRHGFWSIPRGEMALAERREGIGLPLRPLARPSKAASWMLLYNSELYRFATSRAGIYVQAKISEIPSRLPNPLAV